MGKVRNMAASSLGADSDYSQPMERGTEDEKQTIADCVAADAIACQL
jgi:hypothetical protein